MEFSRQVRISSNLSKDWQDICEELSMKAIPIKYVQKVDVEHSTGFVITIDVPQLLREHKDPDIAGKALEDLIQSRDHVKLVTYVIDFDKIKGEVAFSSSRLGKDGHNGPTV
jgi:hypothetical protein